MHRRTLSLVAALAAAAACRNEPALAPPASANAHEGIEAQVDAPVALTLEHAPGNLTITPQGRRILSLHQFYNPPRVLAEAIGSGTLVNYPAPGEGLLPDLASVLGIRSDTAGVLYILDNGFVGKAPPKLVLWDSRREQLVRVIPLRAVTDTNSFINDLAFDYKRNHVYISDPAGGSNAAIIDVDLGTGAARRLLQGHPSVVPEPIDVVVEGRVPTQRLRDGSLKVVRTGVDGIGIDYENEWVYYGPLNGTTMYRVRAADLANGSSEQAAHGVERYAHKPPSDGIVLDAAGNIYLGDLPGNAIGVITTDRQYRQLVSGSQYKWIDDFEFGTDGQLYVVATQLHRSPELNKGFRDPEPPWLVFRMQPLAPGRQGR